MDIEIKKKAFDLSQPSGRVRHLRYLMGLSQKEVSPLGFSLGTLIKIENDQIPITQKQANMLVHIANEKGFFCSPSWLMTGDSEEPYAKPTPHDKKPQEPIHEDYSDLQILQEIIKFKENHPDSLVLRIKDTAMAPYLNPGDYVGGLRIDINQFSELNKHYIVEFKNGLQLVRSIKKLPNNTFKLVSPSTPFDTPGHVVSHQDIQALYPVVWKRNKLRFS